MLKGAVLERRMWLPGGSYIPNPQPPPPSGGGTNVTGPRFNDLVSFKTSGVGGNYVDGILNLATGVYFFDPFDLTTGEYVRGYDALKPNNNWLIFREKDGPGTVTFDMRPESAAAFYGQTQTQAYNDGTHGGAFRAQGVGELRWIFDGNFQWRNGQISLGAGAFPGAQKLIFHGGQHQFPTSEWRRQYDIIRALRGVADPGSSIPNDSPPSLGLGGNGAEPNGGPYWQTYNAEATRWHGNNQPTCFRCNGAQDIYIIRADIGPCGDDAIFGGIDNFGVIGCVIHEVGTTNGANLGAATAWFHPDVFQSAGGIGDKTIAGQQSKGLICDCTIHGHFNFGAEFGHIRNLILDRIWEGNCGIIGGIAYKLGGWDMVGSQYGLGAPITRLAGHFYKGFSNGIDHLDTFGQVGLQVGDNGWHAAFQHYGDSQATFANFSVAVPSGVTTGTVSGTPDIMTSALSTFLNSTAVPHYLFDQAYSTSELATVMSHYGIPFN